jgi:Endosomal/lysosomal potassium channel TMEM175
VEHHIDERLVHRLEAFSDIVIALSMSEIAFNLQAPARDDILVHPIFIVAFLGGFAFVASVWWLHSRIFARYFIPDTTGIIANFILLAATVLFAWAQHLFYRLGFDVRTAVVYAVSGGTVYALIGLLFLRGARDQRLQLSGAERTLGRQRGTRALVVGIILLLSIAAAPLGTDWMEYCWILPLPAMLLLRRVQGKPTPTSSA